MRLIFVAGNLSAFDLGKVRRIRIGVLSIKINNNCILNTWFWGGKFRSKPPFHRFLSSWLVRMIFYARCVSFAIVRRRIWSNSTKKRKIYFPIVVPNVHGTVLRRCFTFSNLSIIWWACTFPPAWFAHIGSTGRTPKRPCVSPSTATCSLGSAQRKI